MRRSRQTVPAAPDSGGAGETRNCSAHPCAEAGAPQRLLCRWRKFAYPACIAAFRLAIPFVQEYGCAPDCGSPVLMPICLIVEIAVHMRSHARDPLTFPAEVSPLRRRRIWGNACFAEPIRLSSALVLWGCAVEAEAEAHPLSYAETRMKKANG